MFLILPGDVLLLAVAVAACVDSTVVSHPQVDVICQFTVTHGGFEIYAAYVRR